MAVNMEELIHILEANCKEVPPDILSTLKAHEEELEACDGMGEAFDRVLEILTEKFSEEDASADASGEIKLSEEKQEYMDRATAAVEELLNSKGWHYKTRKARPDFVIYELDFQMEYCSLLGRIQVEANPEVCCVDAVLPIKGEKLYEYPICEKITKFNYIKRFGALKYDERDGEITYEYSFPSGKGIDPEELHCYLKSVLSSGDDAYHELKRCCVGRFSSEETEKIQERYNAMVKDLCED